MTVNYEGFPEWRITREEYADLSVVAAPGIVYAEGDDLTPDQARKYAHALLAAADHADAPTASTHTAPTNTPEGDTHDRSF